MITFWKHSLPETVMEELAEKIFLNPISASIVADALTVTLLVWSLPCDDELEELSVSDSEVSRSELWLDESVFVKPDEVETV